MKRKFLVLGGDFRNVELAQMLAKDQNKVITYGLEKSEEINENNEIDKIEKLENAIEKAEIIIAPTPFSTDKQNLNAPFSKEKIMINDLIKSNKNKIFIAGGINEKIKEELDKKYQNVIDVMKREELSILNTIATAEGTIVANKFSLLSTTVTCAARKTSDLAWIKAYGYESLNINDMLYDLNYFDIIINTVPQTIIKEKELKHMKSDVLLIDLASYPGGIDGTMASKMGMKFVWALALPGKVAPKSSAQFIKDTIYNILENNEKNNKQEKCRITR